MTRTLITGAAGFTGPYVAEILAAQAHELHGLIHGDVARIPSGFAKFHEANLCDLDSLRRIVREVQPDHVLHLAAISFVAHSDVDEMYRVNVVGTRQLLQALSELPRKPSSIVLASSANVYGNARGGVLDEAMPVAPANDYGVSKVAMETVASLYRATLPIVVARPFNYTGRGQSPHFIIPKIVDHVSRREPVIELGNLEIARDFSDVRTIADAYARLLGSSTAVGQTVNVCSGRAVSLREVLDLAAALSGHRMEVRVNPKFVRTNEVQTLLGSPAKIEDIIGPLRNIPLDETIRWMLGA